MPWRSKIAQLFSVKGRVPKSAVLAAFVVGVVVAGIGIGVYVRQSFNAELTEWAVLYTAIVLAFALALIRSASRSDKDD